MMMESGLIWGRAKGVFVALFAGQTAGGMGGRGALLRSLKINKLVLFHDMLSFQRAAAS